MSGSVHPRFVTMLSEACVHAQRGCHPQRRLWHYHMGVQLCQALLGGAHCKPAARQQLQQCSWLGPGSSSKSYLDPRRDSSAGARSLLRVIPCSPYSHMLDQLARHSESYTWWLGMSDCLICANLGAISPCPSACPTRLICRWLGKACWMRRLKAVCQMTQGQGKPASPELCLLTGGSLLSVPPCRC